MYLIACVNVLPTSRTGLRNDEKKNSNNSNNENKIKVKYE